MARITVEDCIDKFPSRFELVLVASQRARKLHSGDEPMVEKDNDKNTVIALREIAESSQTVDQMKENLIQEYQTVTISDEEEENLEIEALDSEGSITNTVSEEVSNQSIEVVEAEKEMSELISTEESEIEEQYEISDSLENTIDENETEEQNNNLDQVNDQESQLDEEPLV